MLYSIRMRAAQGASHEEGGRHISGVERLVKKDDISRLVQDALDRAFLHSRGRADFININVEYIDESEIKRVPLLPITTIEVVDVQDGHKAAKNILMSAGVALKAIDSGFELLLNLKDSMRGAVIICSESGKRLDNTHERGIRVSRMDVDDDQSFTDLLAKQKLTGSHIREAVVLASKVVSAKDVVAELCWSDDPEYTAGYVASKNGYIRFPHLKPYGNSIGGRIFFVKPASNISELIDYLEKKPVLINTPERV
ncbi:6-carboxyhexanoate--CoA ligase [Selenomonadales bacterium OttesenSCG-928-I06]|nr:6-carboxyhexanoate--CoA ligase [Selenomonadales bacterium OttesenSCG-928-I06]